MMIGVLGAYFIPMIVKSMQVKKVEDKITVQEELIDKLNITVVNQEDDKKRDFEITTIKEPVIVVTPTPQYEIEGYDYYKFRYSYYNPDLGGVNCHTDNWDIENEKCADVTASGKSWKQNMYRGIAVHYDQLFDLPFGTIVEVIKPAELKGFYEIIDICPGCNPRPDDPHYYIDFLDDRQRLNWGDMIELRVKIKNTELQN
jgi:hypothetical protein